MKPKDSREVETALKFPAVCERGLEERALRWDCQKRREMANKLERRAVQLRFSVDLMERFQGQQGLIAPVEFPDWAQEKLRDATELERIALATRQEVLDDLKIKLPAEQTGAVVSPSGNVYN